MKKLLISQDKCIGCGICVSVCPAYHLTIKEKKSVEEDSLCIQCGQCQAVCPKEAITVERLASSPVIPTKDINHNITPEQLKDFYLTRRSSRFYKDKNISKETFDKLIKYATINDGSYFNIQTTEYAVIDERFQEFKKHLLYVLKDEIDKDRYMDLHGDQVNKNDFVRYFNMYMNGEFPKDPFFHEGRQAIAVFSKHPVDAAYGMTHIESMAHAMGLGGFWLGYAITASELEPEKMMDFFPEIDQTKRMYAIFVLGYPKTNYLRTTPKAETKITYM